MISAGFLFWQITAGIHLLTIGKMTFLTTSYYSIIYNPTAETLDHAVINKPWNFNHYCSLLQSRQII